MSRKGLCRLLGTAFVSLLLVAPGSLTPQSRLSAPPVLVVVNENSPLSRSIGEYYSRIREIPAANVLRIHCPDEEEISRAVYSRDIAGPLMLWFQTKPRALEIRYIVLTQGVPLKIQGTLGMQGDAASVDSEVAAMKLDLNSAGPHALPGPLANPYFQTSDASLSPIFLVARLAGYAFADVKGLIERAKQARNRGVVVLDQRDDLLESDGDLWLLRTANRLPKQRVVLDQSAKVLRGVTNVIGYASWGSNDIARSRDLGGIRDLGFKFLPGAIVTEYVSSNGRTFAEPPADWRISDYRRPFTRFAGTPQSLSADFVRQGATGVSGNVYEPYLHLTPRPEILFPAYVLQGRTLGEAYWMSIPAVSWMSIVIGDPLCVLKP